MKYLNVINERKRRFWFEWSFSKVVANLRKFHEKKKKRRRSKRKIVTYWRERKRPCCFDDFSRHGNIPRLRGRFVASRASGVDFSCDSLCRKSHRTKNGRLYVIQVTKIGRKSLNRSTALFIIYLYDIRLPVLFFFQLFKMKFEKEATCW